MFKLDPILEKDTIFLGDLSLSRVLLMNNSLFPWLILVPRKENLSEIIDLSPRDSEVLLSEIRYLSLSFKKLFNPTKLNVAALGNQVKQLHVHVIARFENDQAWPNPVWGYDKVLYTDEQLDKIVTRLKATVFEL